mgnify:CR=1 FL=1
MLNLANRVRYKICDYVEIKNWNEIHLKGIHILNCGWNAMSFISGAEELIRLNGSFLCEDIISKMENSEFMRNSEDKVEGVSGIIMYLESCNVIERV